MTALYAREPFQIRAGATRVVLLVGPYAIKVPRASSWKGLLVGLLANIQERTFAATRWPELCPVLASDPWGLVVVMPRCAPAPTMTLCQYHALTRGSGHVVPAEYKASSFGLLNGRIVAVDYGS